MKRITIIILLVISAVTVNAQDNSNFGIKFSGFVKNDFFIDSRQIIAARSGHFLLWPAPELLDANGNDINAQPIFNILAIQSRLTGTITGPDAFGAKTSGVIEGDFFAQANFNINLFRLRHAFVKLNWTRFEVLAGQTWNPLFVTDCFPGTVSFNTGTPLQSFARNPQVRFTFKQGGLRIMAAALSQLDYVSWGEIGPTCEYIRNSATPDMHLQVSYGIKNDETGTGITFGGNLAYKTIVPRLQSAMGLSEDEVYKVNEIVNGLTAMAYSKLTTRPVTVKFQARYGENISDLLSISGFAVKEVTNTTTGELAYTPLKNMTFWGEVHTNGSKVQVGVFGGILNNLGTKEAMADPDNEVYGLGTKITSLVRVSPRIVVNSGKVRLAFELEYTQAAYGENYNEFYVAGQTTSVSNIRGLASIYYFF